MPSGNGRLLCFLLITLGNWNLLATMVFMLYYAIKIVSHIAQNNRANYYLFHVYSLPPHQIAITYITNPLLTNMDCSVWATIVSFQHPNCLLKQSLVVIVCQTDITCTCHHHARLPRHFHVKNISGISIFSMKSTAGSMPQHRTCIRPGWKRPDWVKRSWTGWKMAWTGWKKGPD